MCVHIHTYIYMCFFQEFRVEPHYHIEASSMSVYILGPDPVSGIGLGV